MALHQLSLRIKQKIFYSQTMVRMQHYPLWPRQVFGLNFREAAMKMMPVYKQCAPEQAVIGPVKTDEKLSFSSPVCYAHLKGMREGFEE